jgi:hypothetical protein
MKKLMVMAVLAACSASLAAQWPKIPDPTVPRDAKGNINYDAPTPRTPDGKPDFAGIWMAAQSGPPRGNRGREGAGRAGEAGRAGRQGAPAAAPAPENAVERETRAIVNGEQNPTANAPARGGVSLEPQTGRFPFDPSGPPVATFFEAGGNLEGGLPYTQWAKDLKKARMDLKDKDNPDANCMPMGFLQFHQQPQPRKIMNISNPKSLLVEWEANYGLWHIYLDGRKLPPQGEPQPWWYGYSVGHWEGDTLVVETNNLRGAEDSANDGWLDVNGSPYSEQAKFTHKIRRLSYGHLQMDITIEDAKAYTKPFTVRIDQRIAPDQEMIEFICNENQQFRRRIQVDEGNGVPQVNKK